VGIGAGGESQHSADARHVFDGQLSDDQVRGDVPNELGRPASSEGSCIGGRRLGRPEGAERYSNLC
jgi:hypothetical protein